MRQSQAVLLAILLVAVAFLAYDTRGDVSKLKSDLRQTVADLRGGK